MIADLRVCFVGESFVAGVGDPEHLGWVGRLAAWTESVGQPLTSYNLGVRRETSTDLVDRWSRECGPRLPSSCDGRVVVSSGVNDTDLEGGVRRVAPETSVENLRALLGELAEHRRPALVVGPPPVADPAHSERVLALDAGLVAVCREGAVPYVGVAADLIDDATWRDEVAAGDGSHPGAAGYRRLAELVWPRWCSWLGLPG